MKKKLLILFILFTSIIFINQYAKITYAEDGNVIIPETGLKDPLGLDENENAPQIIIGRIINTVLGIVGSIALLMFVYGGFVWMTAAGGTENITKGKNILIWATIGLVIIFSSYAMVKFVINGVTGQSISSGSSTNNLDGTPDAVGATD